MLPSIPRQGPKIRFLLHALHAGWSPVTKSTHRHHGAYRSNIKDSYLVLFKGPFFFVLEKTGATLVTRVKNPSSGRLEYSNVAHFSYRMKYHPRKPFLVSHFGLGKLLFNLEYPEWGFFEPTDKMSDIPLKEIHAALTDLLVQTGVAPNRGEFLELVRLIVGGQDKAYKAIRAGEGVYWKSVRGKKEGRWGVPPIRHYPVLLSKNPPSR